jgi:hypothetical protein
MRTTRRPVTFCNVTFCKTSVVPLGHRISLPFSEGQDALHRKIPPRLREAPRPDDRHLD